MTPGYPILMGAVFALTGFSFECARAFSALFLAAGFLALVLALRSLRVPWLGLLLLSGVFLGRDFVLSGNLARMEALLIAVYGGAALLLVRGRRLEAVAALAFAPLVHPNALLPAVAAGLYALTGRIRSPQDWQVRRVGALCLAAMAVAWLGYATYVALHWGEFLHDMAFQLRWKEQPGPLEAAFWRAWLSPWRIALGLGLALALAGGVATRAPARRLLWIALPLWLLPLTEGEWYYGSLRALIFGLTAVCALDVSVRLAERRGAGPRARAAVALCVLLVAVGVGRHWQWIPSPWGYPHALQVAGMSLTRTPAYIDEGDRAVVRAHLERVAARSAGGPPPTVLFVPWADALFFHELDGAGLRLAHPTLRTVRPDLAIVHLTRLIPERDVFYARQNLIAATRHLPVLRARDDSEEWRVNPSPRPVSHGAREARRRR
jgi:hypothetical protein